MVIQDGKIWGSSLHDAAAAGARVDLAFSALFSNGNLVLWKDDSGHFRPGNPIARDPIDKAKTTELPNFHHIAEIHGFPRDKFEKFKPTPSIRDPQRSQLPVIQRYGFAPDANRLFPFDRSEAGVVIGSSVRYDRIDERGRQQRMSKHLENENTSNGKLLSKILKAAPDILRINRLSPPGVSGSGYFTPDGVAYLNWDRVSLEAAALELPETRWGAMVATRQMKYASHQPGDVDFVINKHDVYDATMEELETFREHPLRTYFDNRYGSDWSTNMSDAVKSYIDGERGYLHLSEPEGWRNDPSRYERFPIDMYPGAAPEGLVMRNGIWVPE